MVKKLMGILLLLQTFILLGKENITIPSLPVELKPETSLIPELPNELENVDEDGNIRKLEKNFTIMMESKVGVFVPLEIITDISINTTVFGNQTVQVPFEIELNREPEKKDFYKIIYSENKIDIDHDGKFDTFIYSPEYANSKIISDNYVEVQGANITQAGTYNKKVYITVEAGI